MEQSSSDKDKIQSFAIERNFLSGLIRSPEVIYELDHLLSEIDFASPVASKIYGILRHLIVDKETKIFDNAIILANIEKFGYKFPSNCNISEYIGSLIKNSKEVEYKTTLLLAKDIKLFSIRREVYECGTSMQKKMVDGKFENINEIISVAGEVYFDAVNNFVVEDDYSNLSDGAEQELNRMADNPVDSLGFTSGYPSWDDMIGGIREDSFNFICARAKVGKSIMGLNISCHVAANEQIPVLYADSELNKKIMWFRAIAHLAQVDIYWIETGKWKSNKEVCPKVEKAIQDFKKLKIVYVSTRGKNAQAFISICQRFLFRDVKRNASGQWNKHLIIWDYLKLDVYSDKNISNNWWLDVAKSTIMFKDFLGKSKGAAIVLGQQNSTGITKKEGKNGKMIAQDNESTVALTDEINKTSSNVSIVRHKTDEEIQKDGEQNGDYIMLPLVTREGRGSDWIKTSEGVFEKEYVCLKKDSNKMTFKEVNTNKKIRNSQSLGNQLK